MLSAAPFIAPIPAKKRRVDDEITGKNNFDYFL